VTPKIFGVWYFKPVDHPKWVRYRRRGHPQRRGLLDREKIRYPEQRSPKQRREYKPGHAGHPEGWYHRLNGIGNQSCLNGGGINKQAALLIAQGLQVPYLPPIQSEELVGAILRVVKTYEYINYPDEGHSILHRSNLLNFYSHMECFLEWYLL